MALSQRLRLILPLLAGGLLGGVAGVTSNRILQTVTICLAAVVGIVTGLAMRKARRTRLRSR